LGEEKGLTYFVTGATGFIGRHLVEQLLQRDGDIHVLVREGSTDKLDALIERWGPGARERVKPVIGDLAQPQLGVDPSTLQGKVDHFFHLAAIYDMTADDERNEQLNVAGTRHAVELANAVGAGCLHHTSSIAAAGNFKGLFREDHFDEGQELPSAYHRTKFESEKIARNETLGPVAGLPPRDRRRPLADRRDGQDRRAVLLLQAHPEAARMAAAVVPARRPELGNTNVVPVDYVARRWTTSPTSPTSTARPST
jgi:hypothetical protein